MRPIKALATLVVALGGISLSPAAGAAFIGTFEGNDCAGEFGSPFADCKIPSDIDPDESPIIIKFNYDDGVPGAIEINSALFPTVDGSEFDIDLSGGDDPGDTGSWTYTPGPGDPVIRFYVTKAGNAFNVFSADDLSPPQTGDWATGPDGVTPGQALSHIDFYDTGRVVPEPASLALLGLSLAGIALLRRRLS